MAINTYISFECFSVLFFFFFVPNVIENMNRTKLTHTLTLNPMKKRGVQQEKRKTPEPREPVNVRILRSLSLSTIALPLSVCARKMWRALVVWIYALCTMTATTTAERILTSRFCVSCFLLWTYSIFCPWKTEKMIRLYIYQRCTTLFHSEWCSRRSSSSARQQNCLINHNESTQTVWCVCLCVCVGEWHLKSNVPAL